MSTMYSGPAHEMAGAQSESTADDLIVLKDLGGGENGA